MRRGDKTEQVRRYVEEIWGDGKTDLLGDYLAEDCVLTDLYGDNVIRGLAGVKASIDQWRTMMASVQARVLHVIEDDAAVAWQWSLAGTWKDTAPVRRGGPAVNWPGGQDLVLAGITFSTFHQDRIVREETQADLRGLIEQMGYELR